jgi:hypothetical protein
MRRVYIVQHVHEAKDGSADVKLIGIYSSRELADAAIARLRSQPGFSSAPAGFLVDEYELDRDQWSEVSVSPGESS